MDPSDRLQPAISQRIAALSPRGRHSPCPRCQWIAPSSAPLCANCALPLQPDKSPSESPIQCALRVEQAPLSRSLSVVSESAASVLAKVRALSLDRVPSIDEPIAYEGDALSAIGEEYRSAARAAAAMGGRALIACRGDVSAMIVALAHELRVRRRVERTVVAKMPLAWEEELRRRSTSLPITVESELRRSSKKLSSASLIVIVDEVAELAKSMAWLRPELYPYLVVIATNPLQGRLRNLHRRVDLVRPGLLGTHRAFAKQSVIAGAPLVARDPRALAKRLRRVLVTVGAPITDDDRALDALMAEAGDE